MSDLTSKSLAVTSSAPDSLSSDAKVMHVTVMQPLIIDNNNPYPCINNYLVNVLPNDDGMNGNEDDDKEVRRKLKHRQSEKKRHETIIQLINELKSSLNNDKAAAKRKTQKNTLNRAAKYCLFLNSITEKLTQLDGNENTTIDDSEILQIYWNTFDDEKKVSAFNVLEKNDTESAKTNYTGKRNSSHLNLIDNDVNDMQAPKNGSGQISTSPDYCLPLKKRSKMIMFNDS